MNLIALLDKYPPRTVQAGSRTLSYRESGTGARTMVLLHGVGTIRLRGCSSLTSLLPVAA